MATIGLAALCVGVSSAHAAARPEAQLVVHGRSADPASRTAHAQAAAQPLSPAAIRTAYSLPARGAAGQKVAIIVPFNDPYVASDLAKYDAYFDLPACTVANGCLTIRNELGKAAPLPANDPTRSEWWNEASIGTQTVHGVCESCKIMLFEANTVDSQDLASTVNAAADAGATTVVTTFEPVESSADTDEALAFSHQHTAVVSATGEALSSTYGYSGSVNFPASLSGVLAVGGTSISLTKSGTYGAEQAWSDSVSGCSLFALAPAWQLPYAKAVGCGQMRSIADLSAEANPGVLAYVAHSIVPGGPWYQASGTSVAAPIIAAEIGLAGSLGSNESQDLYANAKADPAAFRDITRGKTSATCPSKLCEAAKGYDGPTGLGTPHGLAAFLKNGGELPAGTPAVTASAKGVGANWKLTPTIRNGLAIALTGKATMTATLGGHTVTLGSHSLSFGPLGTETLTLTIPTADRSKLAAARRTTVTFKLAVHGVGGRTATVSRKLTLTFPS